MRRHILESVFKGLCLVLLLTVFSSSAIAEPLMTWTNLPAGFPLIPNEDNNAPRGSASSTMLGSTELETATGKSVLTAPVQPTLDPPKSLEDPEQVKIDIEEIFEGFGDEEFRSAVPVRPRLDLQLFGFDFFRNAARHQPHPLALVGPDYVIGPGDTLHIHVWGNIEGNYSVTVDRNGEITLPGVGVINLWGQSFGQARETVKNQFSRYYKNFEINVTMGGLRSIQVFVVGEVATPGSYDLSSLATLLTALSRAGGPSSRGSLRSVQLMRQGAVVSEFDVYDFLLSGDKNRDVRLQSGDTIFVPMSGPLVGVAGNVRRPAIYELKGGETLADCLALAGGVNPTAYLNKVQIQRVVAHQQRQVLDLNLEIGGAEKPAALAFPMQDRDLIQVSPIAVSGGFVSLQGYVVRPGRYEYRPGMRLSDLLIPYDNLLPEYYPHAAQIIHRAPPEFRPEIVTVDLRQALEGDPEQNRVLREYDEVRLFSRSDMEELPEVFISGAVLNAGSYRLLENMTVRDLVTVAGSLRRSAYTDEAEITRYLPGPEGTRVERFYIDLSKALAGHPQHDLPMKSEDHLVVRSIPDYGERLRVTIRGEVRFPGTYAIRKGETLSSVLERAGGYTEKAYLRGAIFSREALKQVQREQINRLIAEEEQQITRVAQDIAAGALSPEEARSAQSLLENRRQLLDRLRQTPVTGRLVVRMKELDELRGTPRDIALMSEDEILIPRNPQTVNVHGQVFNSASLSWVPGKTVGYYLNQVGGTRKTANTKEIFIVRADGTVVSRQQSGFGVSWDTESRRWNMGGFNNVPIYPGDSILVPEQFRRVAWLRGIRDISTIIYQMALGAAAVASF